MGNMADLKLAACMEENGRLRRSLTEAMGALAAARDGDRMMSVEVQMISALLSNPSVARAEGIEIEVPLSVVKIGRSAARLYFEQLAAESASDEGELPVERGE